MNLHLLEPLCQQKEEFKKGTEIQTEILKMKISISQIKMSSLPSKMDPT
jgi:hypothetical protein